MFVGLQGGFELLVEVTYLSSTDQDRDAVAGWTRGTCDSSAGCSRQVRGLP